MSILLIESMLSKHSGEEEAKLQESLGLTGNGSNQSLSVDGIVSPDEVFEKYKTWITTRTSN